MLCFVSSRRRHTRFDCDWSSDVCSSDLQTVFHRGPNVPRPAQEKLSPPECSTGSTLQIAEPAVIAERCGVRVFADFRAAEDRKSTRLNSSHSQISYAVFCLKTKTTPTLT